MTRAGRGSLIQGAGKVQKISLPEFQSHQVSSTRQTSPLFIYSGFGLYMSLWPRGEEVETT